MATTIRSATINDLEEIYHLYMAVTKHNVGNLTQYEDEITIEYIAEVINLSLKRGLMPVMIKDGKIIGCGKAYTSQFKCLAHILENATFMIHPDYQKKQYGAILLIHSLNYITKYMPHISMMQILPHANNKLAISMYKKLNFVEQACIKKKIYNTESFTDECIMIWENPNFNIKALEVYHDELKIQNKANQNLLHLQTIEQIFLMQEKNKAVHM